MLFYSFEFLYLFLPATLFGYYAIGKSSRPHLALLYLVLCSLFFYGWWDYKYVALICTSITFNYLCGRLLQRSSSKLLLLTSIALNLALIGYYKYTGLFISTINQLTDLGLPAPNIVLPLAISFFTFQQIAWLADNWSGNIATGENNFVDYCLFVLFFPQLIAGPIVHHSEMMSQFYGIKKVQFQSACFTAGLTFFVIGLAKKVILADNLAPVADQTFALAAHGSSIGTIEAWTGSLAYSMQLYFDFSGYADMAIGLALLFNIRLPLNFNSPYKSLSIAEFWRRWHMTLSRFLRDYVYIAMGGSRKGVPRRYIALMTTMLLGGLWHGAAWTFVFWGGLHGLFLAVNHVWRRSMPFQLPAALSWLITFLCVVFAWVVFRAETFPDALKIFHSMTTLQLFELSDPSRLFRNALLVVTCILICILLPNTQQLISGKYTGIAIYDPEVSTRAIAGLKRVNSIKLDRGILSLLFTATMAIISIMYLLNTTTVNEFIYFQF